MSSVPLWSPYPFLLLKISSLVALSYSPGTPLIPSPLPAVPSSPLACMSLPFLVFAPTRFPVRDPFSCPTYLLHALVSFTQVRFSHVSISAPCPYHLTLYVMVCAPWFLWSIIRLTTHSLSPPFGSVPSSRSAHVVWSRPSVCDKLSMSNVLGVSKRCESWIAFRWYVSALAIPTLSLSLSVIP